MTSSVLHIAFTATILQVSRETCAANSWIPSVCLVRLFKRQPWRLSEVTRLGLPFHTVPAPKEATPKGNEYTVTTKDQVRSGI